MTRVQELGQELQKVLNIIPNNYDKDFTPVFLSAEEWAANNASETENILNQYHLLIARSFTQEYEEIIALGKYLLKQETALGKRKTAYVIKILFELFRKIELHNEMLQLMPQKFWNMMNFKIIRHTKHTYEYQVALLYYRLKNYEQAIEGFLFQAEKFDEQGRSTLQGKYA